MCKRAGAVVESRRVWRLTVTEILADMKAKGSGSLKNMKDEDEDEDGAEEAAEGNEGDLVRYEDSGRGRSGGAKRK